MQNLHKAENISFKDFPVETTRLRFFGGTTNHWGGMCKQLDEVDFEREYGDLPGWPISKNELTPYMLRAHKICDTPIPNEKQNDAFRFAAKPLIG
ncbi:hypothetical protein [Aestuariibacter salexigens]|uniref:hypothetical protein n=1 Tax=Aestuariibacter salexigens TaxID=226010 RepID=UPI000478A672|nr:hypothetical protein [Aestuariibacter salexigens]